MRVSTSQNYHDPIYNELHELRSHMQLLQNENSEIKKYLTEITKSRYELGQEVQSLKDALSTMLSQHEHFDASLFGFEKEVAFLRKDNAQIKSKCDIIQLKLKGLQNSPKDQEDLMPQGSSHVQKPSEAIKQDEKEATPKMEKIGNQTTKDRLENLRKDLDVVFKRDEGKARTLREKRHNTGNSPDEVNYKNGYHPMSLDSNRLKIPLSSHHEKGPSVQMSERSYMVYEGSPKSPFLYMTTGDHSTFSKSVHYIDPNNQSGQARRPESHRWDETGRASPLSIGNVGTPQARTNVLRANRRSGADRGFYPEREESQENDEKAEIFGVSKNKKIYLNRINLDQNNLMNTASSTNKMVSSRSTTSTNVETQKSSSHSQGPRDQYSGKMEQVMDNPLHESFSMSSNSMSHIVDDSFGMMDLKTKKELYLKGENMLMGVLDQREGYLPLRSSPRPVAGGFSQQSEKSVHPEFMKETVPNNNAYYLPTRTLETIEPSSAEKKYVGHADHSNSPHNVGDGTTMSSSRGGTKKLKLVIKNKKEKDSISLQESFSSYITNDN